MSRDPQQVQTFMTLPFGSRVYVLAVVLSGAAALVEARLFMSAASDTSHEAAHGRPLDVLLPES